MSKVFFDKIPVVRVPRSINDSFAELLSMAKKTNDETAYSLIEDTLYTLYGLTDEERELVASTTIE